MDFCFKCGSDNNLEEFEVPYNRDDPGYTDHICQDCLNKSQEDFRD